MYTEDSNAWDKVAPVLRNQLSTAWCVFILTVQAQHIYKKFPN